MLAEMPAGQAMNVGPSEANSQEVQKLVVTGKPGGNSAKTSRPFSRAEAAPDALGPGPKRMLLNETNKAAEQKALCVLDALVPASMAYASRPAHGSASQS